MQFDNELSQETHHNNFQTPTKFEEELDPLLYGMTNLFYMSARNKLHELFELYKEDLFKIRKDEVTDLINKETALMFKSLNRKYKKKLLYYYTEAFLLQIIWNKLYTMAQEYYLDLTTHYNEHKRS
jgi:hypothetical protein